MLRKIKIIEKKSDVVLAVYPINFCNPNFSDREFLNEAWVSAIEDGLVDPDKKIKYKIEMAD